MTNVIYMYDSNTTEVRALLVYKKGLRKFVDYVIPYPLDELKLDQGIEGIPGCFFYSTKDLLYQNNKTAQ